MIDSYNLQPDKGKAWSTVIQAGMCFFSVCVFYFLYIYMFAFNSSCLSLGFWVISLLQHICQLKLIKV